MNHALMGLLAAGAGGSEDVVRALASKLLASQRPEGGFGFTADDVPNPFANDVALRGAAHAETRTAMTNTLSCFSSALMDLGTTNGLIAGRKIGQANLDYANIVRATYDSLSR